eukprot:3218464-Rhodomonas_salina.1
MEWKRTCHGPDVGARCPTRIQGRDGGARPSLAADARGATAHHRQGIAGSGCDGEQTVATCGSQQASGGQAATSTIEKGEHDPEGVTVTSSLMEDTLTILKYFDRARAKGLDAAPGNGPASTMEPHPARNVMLNRHQDRPLQSVLEYDPRLSSAAQTSCSDSSGSTIHLISAMPFNGPPEQSNPPSLPPTYRDNPKGPPQPSLSTII